MACRNEGADLASVETPKENDFIRKMSGDSAIWLGGSDHKKERTWQWIDGTKWSFKNWFINEPSGDGDCMEMYKGWNGKWNDKPCHYKIHAVCKKSKNFSVTNLIMRVVILLHNWLLNSSNNF